MLSKLFKASTRTPHISSSLIPSSSLVPAASRPSLPVSPTPPCQLTSIRGMANHRHKKIIKMAKGYRGRTNCFKIAVQKVERALQYAYRDRKVKKRDFRSLWIQRISAAVQQYGMNYSSFIPGLQAANSTMLIRKVLSDIAMSEPYDYTHVRSSFFSSPHRFIPGLQAASITMDRKVLSDLAVTEPYSFKAVVDTVKSSNAATAKQAAIPSR